MSKVTNYLMTITGLIFILSLGGVDTGQHWVLEQTGLMESPSTFQSSNLFASILALLALGGTATIVIGYFTKTSAKDILIAGYLVFLVYFVGELINIITYANGLYSSGSFNWVSYTILTIFGMLTIGYIGSIVDFYQSGS